MSVVIVYNRVEMILKATVSQLSENLSVGPGVMGVISPLYSRTRVLNVLFYHKYA